MSDYMKEAERLIDDLVRAGTAGDEHGTQMVPVHCTPTEHEGRIVYEHTSEPIPNADGFVISAAPAAPDQFRDAAKMMAVQPACMTCSGHGMVGGLLPNGGGYQADPCHDCAAPVTAEVPMPEPDTHCYDDDEQRDVWSHSADQMRTYGAACRAAGEAAGYARGLAEAGRDAERYRTVRFLATAERDPLPEYAGDTSSPDAFDASIDHATAALRGEVK